MIFYSTKCDFCEEAEQQHTFKVTGYTFEEKEKLADGELPTATATVACLECGKELSVPATVVGAADEEGNAVYDVEVTCLVDGERTFTASVEDYEDAEGVESSKKYTIEALGHDFDYEFGQEEYVPVVITEEGVIKKADPDTVTEKHALKCKNCGDVDPENTEGLLDHVIPENGYYSSAAGHAYKCAFCEGHGTLEAHTPVEFGQENVKEPTCYEKGLTTGKKCSVCGFVTEEPQEIEMLPHNMSTTSNLEWEKDENGYYTGKYLLVTGCTNPGCTVRETVEKEAEKRVRSEATCTTEGEVLYVATEVEPEVKLSAKTPMLAHQFEKVEAVEPTCEKAGNVEHYKCTVCGKTYGVDEETGEVDLDNELDDVTREQLAHNYGTPVIEWYKTNIANDPWEARATATCTICLSATEEVQVNKSKITTPATCTEKGKVLYSATAKSSSGQEVLSTKEGETPALGHDFERDFFIPGVTNKDIEGAYVDNEDGTHTYTCQQCKKATKVVEHNYTNWEKVSGKYESTCEGCKNKITTYDFSEILTKYGPKVGEGDNANPTLVITLKDDANFSQANEIPEGVKLIVSAGKTMTISNDFVVKGILEIEQDSHCTVSQGKSLTVDEKVAGAKVEGKVEGTGKFVKEINTPEAFIEALNNEDVKEVDIAEGANVVYPADKTSLEEELTINLAKASVMSVTGKLPESQLTISGEGTVALANSTDTENGDNLINVVKAGAEKVVVSENAETKDTVKVDGNNKKLTVEIASGKTIECSESEKVSFNVENGGNLTITGSKDNPATIKNTNDTTAIQNVNGTLDVSNVKVEGTTGVFVKSENSATKLTNVEIKAKDYGFSANATESPKGIGNVTLKDCKIESDFAGLYLPAGGTVTIDGGTIKGKSAVVDKAANLTLTGDLTLIGTDTRNTTKSVSERMTDDGGAQGYSNGTPLLIISQKNYSDGKTVTVDIGDNVKFEYEGTDVHHYDVEIVGVNNVTTDSEGAKLVINYKAITDSTLETDNKKFKPEEITKKYFLDKGEQFKGSITINGK